MSLVRHVSFVLFLLTIGAWSNPTSAADDGNPFNRAQYANRLLLPDFTAPACPDNPRGLEQIKGNLYRHTTGPGLAVHSGLVLVTPEGALVIDPAMTCTAGWLRDEIKRRFNVSVAYVVYTHAHADHISGAQIFQNDGAVVVANQRAVEPIVGEKIPTALPDRVFDKEMTITLGGETVKLHRIAPSHSDSMMGSALSQCSVQRRSTEMDRFRHNAHPKRFGHVPVGLEPPSRTMVTSSQMTAKWESELVSTAGFLLTRRTLTMSAIGPKRTSVAAPHMFAFGCKADIRRT